MSSTGRLDDADEIRRSFAEHGQAQVFRAWERLGSAARGRLLAQARAVDLAGVAAAVERSRVRQDGALPRMAPPRVERLPRRGGDPARRARARELGESLLGEGRVAALVMAGGEGTRLGFEGPKGAFPLGPVSGRSLFELQAQRLRAARRRYGHAAPWCVMTSPATHRRTGEFFRSHERFGLEVGQIRTFLQGTAPCVDLAGGILLAAPDRIAEAPDGHGGVYQALARSGLLAELADAGIRYLATYQVDNPLARPLDPVFLGLHALEGARLSCKVVRKEGPEEPAGTVGVVGGHVRVVEYTEIDAWHREQREPDGSLRFWAASIGMHVIDVALAARVGADPGRWLPFHASAKQVPCWDPEGDRTVVPDSPNGYKLERFVFDGLEAADGAALLEVEREEEYAPIKRPSGAQSPESARRALTEWARRWLEAVGVPPGPWASSPALELDHAQIDDEWDARRGAPGDPAQVSDWILQGGGETG